MSASHNVNLNVQVWSAELSQVAQDYAERCVFDHNDQRTSQQSTFTYIGENLAVTTAGNVNYTSLVRSWYNENQDYSYQTNSCASGAVCGHYTQVTHIYIPILAIVI